MTTDEVIRIRILLNLLAPHDFDPAVGAVINEALSFYTDRNRLNACVEDLVTTTPSRSFAARLTDWLNSAPQTFLEAA